MQPMSSFSQETTSTDSAKHDHAQVCEALARQYIQENFESRDWLAVLLRDAERGETIQRISTAGKISSPEFLAWLRQKNSEGFDVYLGLNTLKDHSRGRTKADIKEIRHLYLDLDQEGPQKLAAIRNDTAVPPPNYVLNTSPGKYQVVWNVRGISQQQSEALLRSLAQRFGGDPAATDSTRVFRFPGFSNQKYEKDFQVTATREAPLSRVYQASDFDLDISAQGRPSQAFAARSAEPLRDREETSQSERDWAYAIRHLKRGDDPDQVIREMAAYRGIDRFDKADPAKLIAPKKPSPQYYAERTVTQAMTHLGMSRSSGAVSEPRQDTAEPTR
jgi:hypothetical protein